MKEFCKIVFKGGLVLSLIIMGIVFFVAIMCAFLWGVQNYTLFTLSLAFIALSYAIGKDLVNK